MSSRFRELIKILTPPLILSIAQRSRRLQGEQSGYFGNYASWLAANQDSAGYDAAQILQCVRDAQAEVRDGRAVYERDGVIFDRIQHSYPLLACLLRVACENGNRLNVLDFGGALGSSYFQCRGFLDCLDELRWNIVEQENFVLCGREQFQNEQLRFYSDIEDCLAEQTIHVVLFSGVLPYLEEPHRILNELVDRAVPAVILDRTPVLDESPDREPDRLTVQRVPSYIYGKAVSYPAWIFNQERLLAHFAERYDLILEFDALAGSVPLENGVSHDRGFFFSLTSRRT